MQVISCTKWAIIGSYRKNHLKSQYYETYRWIFEEPRIRKTDPPIYIDQMFPKLAQKIVSIDISCLGCC